VRLKAQSGTLGVVVEWVLVSLFEVLLVFVSEADPPILKLI
jgi:hypothetical protein